MKYLLQSQQWGPPPVLHHGGKPWMGSAAVCILRPDARRERPNKQYPLKNDLEMGPLLWGTGNKIESRLAYAYLIFD